MLKHVFGQVCPRVSPSVSSSDSLQSSYPTRCFRATRSWIWRTCRQTPSLGSEHRRTATLRRAGCWPPAGLRDRPRVGRRAEHARRTWRASTTLFRSEARPLPLTAVRRKSRPCPSLSRPAACQLVRWLANRARSSLPKRLKSRAGLAPQGLALAASAPMCAVLGALGCLPGGLRPSDVFCTRSLADGRMSLRRSGKSPGATS